jgi:hypothetical protein
MEAALHSQIFQVFYFKGQVTDASFSLAHIFFDGAPSTTQVGQGEIKWKDCAKNSLLRDRVMEMQPKDDAGWPKTMSNEEDARFLETLSEEERHCMVGLGGSQKAEVAWMEANGIAYEKHDVEQFFAGVSYSEKKSVDVFWEKHNAPKHSQQLQKVLHETRAVLRERVAQGTCIAVTSFRKGGVNKGHEFLHQVESCLSLHSPIPGDQFGYVHFQSGFENSLFGWKSGSDECEYGTENYYGLNMKLYWYIEWLEIVNQCAASGGYLIVFDLSGNAAMNSSINCAMELAILYQLYSKGNSGLKLVVLNDDDVVLNDAASLGDLLLVKSQDQDTQAALFEEAYMKCYAFLQSHFAVTTGLHKVGRDWMRDFEAAGGKWAPGLRKGARRLSTAAEGGVEDNSTDGQIRHTGNHRDAARVLVARRQSAHPKATKRSKMKGGIGAPPPHPAAFAKQISLGMGVLERASYEGQNPMTRCISSRQNPTGISGAPSHAPLSRDEPSRVFGESGEYENPMMQKRSASTSTSTSTSTSLSGAPSSAPLSREESAHAFGEEPEQQEEEQQQQQEEEQQQQQEEEQQQQQEEEQQQQQQQQQQQATFNVSVPPGMGPGQLVQIRHPPCGQMLTARQIPPGVYAGQVFSAPLGATPALQQQAPMQFAVEVPPGVVAGQRLQILHPATGQVMQVQVPAWAYAGMRFMVQG